jgi:hypothetical protein
VDKKTLKSNFKVERWSESSLLPERPGIKTTRVEAEYSYFGDLNATSTIHLVMSYGPDGSASFVGIEVVEANTIGFTGSMVLEHRGAFRSGRVDTTIRLLSDSSTHDFNQVSGAGKVVCIFPDRNELSVTLSGRNHQKNRQETSQAEAGGKR